MHKLLTPRIHGYLDLAVVALFLLAPSIWNFNETAAAISYVVGVGHLAMTLLTRFPMGIVKWIPFSAHGSVELIASIALVLIPFFAEIREDSGATAFFRVTGILLFGVWAATDYKASTFLARREHLTLRPTH